MVSVEKSSFISFSSQEKIKGIGPNVVVGLITKKETSVPGMARMNRLPT